MFLTIVKCQTIAIVLGYILDLIIGDPHWLYHPVQLIGRLITFLEKLLLKKDDKDETKYIKGAVLAVLVLFVTGAVVILFLAVFYNISIVAGCIAETIMCYQILAVKSLRVESMKVYAALKQEGIEQARIAVSMIVGRDTTVALIAQLFQLGFQFIAIHIIQVLVVKRAAHRNLSILQSRKGTHYRSKAEGFLASAKLSITIKVE